MTTRTILSAAIAVVTCAASVAVSARLGAQSVNSGAISGEIMDRRGAPLPRAHVEVVDRATGDERSIVSDDNGNYFVRGLPAGHAYSVSVRCIGFLPRTMSEVLPSAAGEITADITLDRINTQPTRTAMRMGGQ